MQGFNQTIHQLINRERKRKGIATIRWSSRLYHLAKAQANFCAKIGYIVHSHNITFKGGENLGGGGKGYFSPKTIVKAWMHSKTGHRENLLNSSAKQAGVGVAKRNGKMYVSWIFSEA